MNEQPRLRPATEAPVEPPIAARRRRRWPRLLFLLLVAGLAAAAYYYYPRQPTGQRERIGRRGDDGPVPVLVAKPGRADVPIYLDGVGTVRALNTVTVRAQVDGQLLSVNFKEGQDVRK